MKFNEVVKGKNQVVNYENAPAYQLPTEWELYTSVVTSSLNDQFYQKTSERIVKLRQLIQASDPEFVARIAIYAREKFYLRSVPLVLAVELAKLHSGDRLVRQMVARIIQRADEITELLAYYQIANQRQGFKKLKLISKQLQAGLQIAFNKFDEYQFAKYNQKTEIRLRDALFLVHPKAKNETQQLIFNKIVRDELQTPYTWETELSALGQVKYQSEKDKAKAFTCKWEELIDSGKVGYMALLRNLRNILEAKVSVKHFNQVCETISAKEKVIYSKQLPFRFLAAYRELSSVCSGYTSKLMDALEAAVCVSAANIAGFNESTKLLIACDVSRSMQESISPNSKIMYYDIGLMLGMLFKSRCKNVVTGIFGETWKIVNLPNSGVLSNVDAFYKREGEVGYATNGYLVIQDLIDKREVMDKIMIFTDCQLWNSRGGSTTMSDVWKKYKTIEPNAKLYLFDLAGHGTTPLDISHKDVYLIAGWSDKIFDILQAIENGSNALKEIKAIQI